MDPTWYSWTPWLEQSFAGGIVAAELLREASFKKSNQRSPTLANGKDSRLSILLLKLIDTNYYYAK
eukprot:1915743-Pleurochrysis_carterae.AAC.1